MDITYEYIFNQERTETFTLQFKDSDLSLNPLVLDREEPWTRLTVKQCKVCTLEPSQHPYCPVARNLAHLLLRFKDDISYEKVSTRVIRDGRIIEKHTSLEEGVSPLMGLIMATSGCPILDKFKPMAFVHYPFANETETIFRAFSIYLSAQYVRYKNNLSPDWEMKNFTDMYTKVSEINSDFAERVREIQGKDANINSLIILDLFAQVGMFSFYDGWLKELEPLFSAYMD